MRDFDKVKTDQKTPDILETKQAAADLVKTENNDDILEPYKIYNNNIYVILDDLKNDDQFIGLSDIEIKKDRAFFPRLIQSIYNNYLGDLLQNKLEYKLQGIKPVYPDIEQLDIIFDIYIDLVNKYKWNNRPSILEFCILTGISRDTIYNWINGDIDNNNIYINKDDPKQDKRKYITNEYIDTARKWQLVCEQSLVDGNGEYVKEIFLLKAKHGYRDNNNDIQITVNHKQLIDADNLPDLIGINGKN